MAAKGKPFGTMEQELQIMQANEDCKEVYIPAAQTKYDVTESVPEVAVLVVGNDDRVTAALANHLRLFIDQYLEVPTVALGNLNEAENFVDHVELRHMFHSDGVEAQNNAIVEEVESIWDGMTQSYPAIRRGQMRVGVEIVQGNVDIVKEVRHTAKVSMGSTKVLDQVLTTIYP